MSTTVLNAFLGPVMKQYVRNFEHKVYAVCIQVAPYVTQSNGSIISISETIDCPIKTAVSGPSAGVIGAIYIGKQCETEQLITFDMGGTSADVCLIDNGEAKLSMSASSKAILCEFHDRHHHRWCGWWLHRLHRQWRSTEGGTHQGGARPGPACYMLGGEDPTVTDANLILGKLNPRRILGGTMDVDRGLAEAAIRDKICANSSLTINEAANGIISVVNSNMVRAIRLISVERGYDVRTFPLMAFGGAGPLHACEVAEEMGISSVIFPSAPGTLCSLGVLMADTRFDLVRSRILEAVPESLEQRPFSRN